MDRIKQALDRARKERATASHDLTDQPLPPSEQVSDITYTRTRVIVPPPEILEHNRVIAAGQDDSVTTAYKVLRTQVLQRMHSNGWNALAITSPGEGEGKSLTAVNLSISIARGVNQTVLLVDLDLRRPSIHKLFGYTPEQGLSDHLLYDAPLSKIFFNPDIERLVIFPGRERLTHSSELLSSPKMQQLVQELKTRYPSRLILFDLPPVLSADDALAFSPYVDAALLVVREGKTPPERVKAALNFLEGTNVLGMVLNQSNESMNPYY